MKREDTFDYNIKSAWHAFSRMYNKYGSEFQLTTSTGFVLLNIDIVNGTPATKIAPLLGLESRSLTRILRNLEEKEWIYRKKDDEDRRSVRIYLTGQGIKKRDIARKSVLELNKQIRSKISNDDYNAFLFVIKTINLL